MAVADTEGTVAIEAAAVRLLGSREHTRAELDRKLRSRFGGSPRLQDVLDDLERRRLLSDQRSAETFVERRSRKGYGPLRIRAELAARGVTDDRAAMALEAMVDGWWICSMPRRPESSEMCRSPVPGNWRNAAVFSNAAVSRWT